VYYGVFVCMTVFCAHDSFLCGYEGDLCVYDCVYDGVLCLHDGVWCVYLPAGLNVFHFRRVVKL